MCRLWRKCPAIRRPRRQGLSGLQRLLDEFQNSCGVNFKESLKAEDAALIYWYRAKKYEEICFTDSPIRVRPL